MLTLTCKIDRSRHTLVMTPQHNTQTSYLCCLLKASLERLHEAILRTGFEISTFPATVASVCPGIIIKKEHFILCYV